jgi:hypothetical protein
MPNKVMNVEVIDIYIYIYIHIYTHTHNEVRVAKKHVADAPKIIGIICFTSKNDRNMVTKCMNTTKKSG